MALENQYLFINPTSTPVAFHKNSNSIICIGFDDKKGKKYEKSKINVIYNLHGFKFNYFRL